MTMILMISLAFFNGLLIVTNRVFNAQLGLHISGTGAAFWNHVVGSIVLVFIVSFLTDQQAIDFEVIPIYLFLGGLIGASYVALNSFVMPHLGATTATVLVIGGQIILATIIDVANAKISNVTITLIGISLIIFGIWLGAKSKFEKAT